jgi:hypothetical protein
MNSGGTPSSDGMVRRELGIRPHHSSCRRDRPDQLRLEGSEQLFSTESVGLGKAALDLFAPASDSTCSRQKCLRQLVYLRRLQARRDIMPLQ